MANDDPTNGTSVLPKPVLTTMGGVRGWDVGGVRSFAYINCLDREYEDTKAKVKRVIFDYSRNGSFQHTIRFQHRVTEKAAILAAEAWLSEPLTQEHYEEIKHDSFHQYEWEDAREVFGCRGECLTDLCYLDIAERKHGHGTLRLWCGS